MFALCDFFLWNSWATLRKEFSQSTLQELPSWRSLFSNKNMQWEHHVGISNNSVNQDLITEVKLLEARKGVEIMFWLVYKIIIAAKEINLFRLVLHTVVQLLRFHNHPPQTICRHLSCAYVQSNLRVLNFCCDINVAEKCFFKICVVTATALDCQYESTTCETWALCLLCK